MNITPTTNSLCLCDEQRTWFRYARGPSTDSHISPRILHILSTSHSSTAHVSKKSFGRGFPLHFTAGQNSQIAWCGLCIAVFLSYYHFCLLICCALGIYGCIKVLLFCCIICLLEVIGPLGEGSRQGQWRKERGRGDPMSCKSCVWEYG